MKKVHLILMVLLSSFVFNVNGQVSKETERSFDITEQLFFTLDFAPFYDAIYSPAVSAKILLPDPNQTSEFIYRPTTYRTYAVSRMTVGASIRYNLYEFGDDVSLAFAVPFAFGLSQAVPASRDVNGRVGFGNVQVPILLKLNYGLGSTYNNDMDVGISLGIGQEYNKVGVMGTTQEIDAYNKGWFMPTISAGVVMYRGGAPIEYAIKYGFGQDVIYSKNVDGNDIQQPVTARASSLKFNISYYLNY